ncbi:hypothetical protein [Streptomyces rhizosphaerihabitans]|uniref:hypothetical protein n=1 Tax=Streptomyces rhizosphaerihabitans TaxID=1266770 RepID=UPI0021C0E65A|nr:hypothetical protein [Streptomyces rhizosphaerihabitans]MCT9009506.1 hypothetical protein [Streptomyces rhizosphaerihabitans]
MLPMSDSWSTLIGAGAAIAGAALAGGFTLLKGRQENADKERDRLEQRLTHHRAIRRDAYLDLLNKAEEVDDLQRDYLAADGAAIGELRVALSTASSKLHQSLKVVRMEGPAHVAEAAQRLVDSYAELSGRMGGGDLTLGELLTTRIETLRIQDEFLTATASALDSGPRPR